MNTDEFATWLAEVTGKSIESITVGDTTHHFIMKEES